MPRTSPWIVIAVAAAAACGRAERPSAPSVTAAVAGAGDAVEAGARGAPLAAPPDAPGDRAAAAGDAAPPAPGDGSAAAVTPSTPEPVRPAIIVELDLALDAIALLERAGWDGEREPLPIRPEDFDAGRLRGYVEADRVGSARLEIPAEIERALYGGPEAAREIGTALLSLRADYLAELRRRGVHPRYLAELDRVLPADPARMIYHPESDARAKATRTESLDPPAGVEKDHGLLVLHVQAVDVWNGARLVLAARLFGEPPAGGVDLVAYHRKLRDLALRQLVYHELTHALQRAFANLHAAPDERTSKTAYYSGDRRLMDVDPRHHWRWGRGGVIAEMNNRVVSMESQADGVSFELAAAAYRLGAPERAVLWRHHFGRLDASRSKLDEIRRRCEARWPDLPQDNLGSLLFHLLGKHPDAELAREIASIALRLSSLPAYVGYMNPMWPEELPRFWRALAD